MKNLLVILAAVLVSTSAFAGDLDGEWSMKQVACSGGTTLDLGGSIVSMSVADKITVSMEVSDLPGCVLRQVSNFRAQAGTLVMTPIANSATEQCGDEFTIDMSPSSFNYVVTADSLKLSSVSHGEGGCPTGETETTLLTRKAASAQ